MRTPQRNQSAQSSGSQAFERCGQVLQVAAGPFKFLASALVISQIRLDAVMLFHFRTYYAKQGWVGCAGVGDKFKVRLWAADIGA